MKPRVTEAEWLSDPHRLARDLSSNVPRQFRKWRLFGVACCRRAMALAPDERLEALAAGAEQFADRLVAWEEVKALRRMIPLIRKELGIERSPRQGRHATLAALNFATSKSHTVALSAADQAQRAFVTPDDNYGAVCFNEELEQIPFIHDIFGNPFRPVAFSPAWRTDTAVSLARGMYESHDFSAMPILADALQDAGCDSDDILNHCRDPKQVHVCGCWVVDLVLGKA